MLSSAIVRSAALRPSGPITARSPLAGRGGFGGRLYPRATLTRQMSALGQKQTSRSKKWPQSWLLSTSSGALDQEVFENKGPLTALQRTATSDACYLAISSWPRWGFDPDNFVFCPAVGAIEPHRWGIGHKPQIATQGVERKTRHWTVQV